MQYKNHSKSHTCLRFLCSNKAMFRTKTKATIALIAILSIASGVQASNLVIQQTNATNYNTTFQVNIVESLSVSVTTPQNWATDNINTFLRNEVGLDVTTNNPNGFTATMYANTGSSDNTNTSLTNTVKSDAMLPTMSASQTRGAFSANQWGYSLDTTDTVSNKTYNNNIYNETSAGNNDSNYYPLPTSSAPATVLTGTTSASRTIFFGAKADVTMPAGTYAGTVVIGVVTDVQNNNNDSSNPVDPVTPSDNPGTDNDPAGTNPAYSETHGSAGTSGWTTYTTRSSSGSGSSATNTTTTQVSDGDTRNTYANAAGVIEDTTANINSGTPLATGLAVTSAVAATSGSIFFLLAKRKKDDDEEEEEEQQA